MKYRTIISITLYFFENLKPFKKFSYKLILLLTFITNAQPGTNDPTFNTIDKGFVNGKLDKVDAIALQTDGKILIAGQFNSYNGVIRNNLARLNSDGSLDTSFDPGTGTNDVVSTIVLQPDGKILIGGSFYTYNGETRLCIARLNPNGSLDTSFDTSVGANSSVLALVIQPDGKILACGQFTSYNDIVRKKIARLNSDGSLDTSFDTSIGANSGVESMTLQLDGKLLIAGQFTTYNGISRNKVARLNSDGSLDMSFDSGIIVNVSGVNNSPFCVAIQKDGKVLLGGDFTTYNGAYRRGIARLNSNGSLDTSFICDGIIEPVKSITLQPDGKIFASTEQYINHSKIYKANGVARLNSDGTMDANYFSDIPSYFKPSPIVLLSDGKLLAGGSFTSSPNLQFGFVSQGYEGIVRLNSDLKGEIDRSFYSGTAANHVVKSMILQPDGKVIIGGDFTKYNGITRNRLARLNSDGSLDINFDPGIGTDLTVTSLAIQPDNKVIIAGWFLKYNGLSTKRIVRLNSDGSLDSSFVTNGAGINGTIYSIALQPDGKVLIVGSFRSYNGVSCNYIARLNTDGSLDTSFNTSVGANDEVLALALQPDGKVIIVGIFTGCNGVRRNRIARLNSDGSLDTSFDPGSGLDNSANCVVLQSDGKIIIGGNFKYFNNISNNYVVRLNSNGSLDTSFVGSNDYNRTKINSIAQQPDGKIIIGGQIFFSVFGLNPLVRMNMDGSLDKSFEIGVVNGEVSTIILQADGKVLVGGDFTDYNGFNRNRITRLNGGDPPLSSYIPNANIVQPFNVKAYPNPSSSSFNISVSSNTEEKLSVFVYDMLGRVIDKTKFQYRDFSLQLGSNYPKGIYNVIVSQGIKSSTVRIIKQ